MGDIEVMNILTQSSMNTVPAIANRRLVVMNLGGGGVVRGGSKGRS